MNYIGSKLSLIYFIDSTIKKLISNIESKVFCDLFSGTSAVGKHFKKQGCSIISNDLQYYSYILSKHYIENSSNYILID